MLFRQEGPTCGRIASPPYALGCRDRDHDSQAWMSGWYSQLRKLIFGKVPPRNNLFFCFLENKGISKLARFYLLYVDNITYETKLRLRQEENIFCGKIQSDRNALTEIENNICTLARICDVLMRLYRMLLDCC